jgi:putative addiction module component (TIGR02574 family)
MMASRVEEIKKEILQFTIQERAWLAEKILESLDQDENFTQDIENEKLIIEEVKRRAHAYENKKIEGIPYEDAINMMRSKYQ